jgi:hypothetical protein
MATSIITHWQTMSLMHVITCCFPRFHKLTMPALRKMLNRTSTSAKWSCYQLLIAATSTRRRAKSMSLSFCLDGMARIKLLTHIPRHQHILYNLTLMLTPCFTSPNSNDISTTTLYYSPRESCPNHHLFLPLPALKNTS